MLTLKTLATGEFMNYVPRSDGRMIREIYFKESEVSDC